MARNKYPEETKKLIIEKATELFLLNGYENTTVQDIIDHLGGLTKGAVYHHFSSKMIFCLRLWQICIRKIICLRTGQRF